MPRLSGRIGWCAYLELTPIWQSRSFHVEANWPGYDHEYFQYFGFAAVGARPSHLSLQQQHQPQ